MLPISGGPHLSPKHPVTSEVALITPGFPGQIYNHASVVVTSGDGIERFYAAEVMCRAAERWPSWPVSQRKGHAVATVDDALLALSVAMQDMCASVRPHLHHVCATTRFHTSVCIPPQQQRHVSWLSTIHGRGISCHPEAQITWELLPFLHLSLRLIDKATR